MDKDKQKEILETEYFKSKEHKEGYHDGYLSALLFFSSCQDVIPEFSQSLKFLTKSMKVKNNIAPVQLSFWGDFDGDN